MKTLLATIAALCAAGAVLAQQPLAPSFDAVSIKANRSGEQGGSSRGQPGRYVGVNVTLMRLVRLAYRPVEEFDGGPEWKEKDRFDIEAVSGASPSQPQMLAMMRTLLADRFKLRVHTETRALPVYELSLARSDGRLGAALTRVADVCPPPAAPGTPAPVAGSGPAIRCGFQLGDGLLKGMGTLPNIASELVVAGRHAVDRIVQGAVAHLLHVLRRMELVGFGEAPAEARGEERSDGRLAAAGNAHDYNDGRKHFGAIIPEA